MQGRVFVGLSGGVDSALACALLVEQGYDVTAIYMRNWSRDLPGFRCAWADDLADAERVAVKLGVDLDVWDYEEEYRRTVVDYLVDAYARGFTPNPDVMCNQTIKFGSFLDRALQEGADYVATGHYARLRSVGGERAPEGQQADGERASEGRGVSEPAHCEARGFAPLGQAGGAEAPVELLRAADEHKDQTYFLWRVPGTRLARALFPIGGYASKAEVRAACAERGLGIEDKPDSDGICFVGEVGIRNFLLEVLERRPGEIVEWESGRVLGHHDGAFLFTVGQRRGLNLGGGPARYVVATDVHENVVYVSADRNCPGLWTREIRLSDCRWVSGRMPQEGRYLVRTRHTGALRPAQLQVVCEADENVATLVFDEPQRSVAAGQSAVVYDGLVCLGGGIIQHQEGAVPPWRLSEHEQSDV